MTLLTLGIECTAHTFGVGIIRGKKPLANIKHTYTTERGGIIPSEAAKHHIALKEKILTEALTTAGITIEDVDLICVSNAPGLSPCLLVGLNYVKELATLYKKPLLGVNHCIAHLEIGKLLTKAKDPVLLYVSGANTQIIALEGGKYRIFGETLDQGVGNFLDSFARRIGLGFPGGPKIQTLATQSNNYVTLPYTVKGMDFSLSGILTNLKQKYDSGKHPKEDLAYSAQETVFAMLAETAERAISHTGKKELLLGGGVGCNTRLQEMCRLMCKERGAKFYVPPNDVLTDNGLMIAWTGSLMHAHNVLHDLKTLDIKPYERTDEVTVRW